MNGYPESGSIDKKGWLSLNMEIKILFYNLKRMGVLPAF